MQDYYDERKRVSSFSWREFARIAGFTSPTYLKLVCEKKTRLSSVGAEKVGAAMRLVGYELDYFKLMVECCHAKTEDDRKIAFEAMLNGLVRMIMFWIFILPMRPRLLCLKVLMS